MVVKNRLLWKDKERRIATASAAGEQDHLQRVDVDCSGMDRRGDTAAILVTFG
jgi:hypothetical protein